MKNVTYTNNKNEKEETMKTEIYQREKVYEYAKKWAYSRNPNYYNFDPVGGDCTSFASQCIYAGSKIMNYSPNKGWYYINGNQKSPSWSGVEFLYDFLIHNQSLGPFGIQLGEENKQALQIGDIAQLSFDGKKYAHTLVITEIQKVEDLNKIKIASHTFDSFNQPIGNYQFQKIRFIHIQGIRK